MKKIFYFILLLIIIIQNAYAVIKGKDSSLTLLSKTSIFKYDNIKDLIVFGDSLSSVNTNFSDMTYNIKGISEGEKWPIHLAKANGMKLWNYAVSGAVADFKIIPRKFFNTSYIDEYQMFLDRMSKGKKFDSWDGQSSLFAIWLGCNEIRCIKHTQEVQKVYNTAINIIFDKIEGMYKVGARNFLILNIPPLDKAPLKEDQNYNYYRYDIFYYNEKLSEYANNFFYRHPDTNIILYNANEQYNYVLLNYQEFGLFTGNTPWTVGRRYGLSRYFWFDNFHPTFRGHQIIADDITVLLKSLNKK
ncbi:hypothetical protein H8356DRAFT_1727902 [Neocallimastix lanati (nom. inval.)]|jgi:phospholipase/lecithinase/hemolysin|nr:hypothetical protein H8356DRAFT_1727902 [Neocallimastix sp. JGI-2020a]